MDAIARPRSLVLPPPYTAHWLPDGSPFEEAQRLAPQDGAGTLIWQQTTGKDCPGRLDFAVVLEPDMPLSEARKGVLVGMVALGDAVAAHAPPERDVRFDWPTGVVLDAGRLGGMRLCVAPDAQEDTPPDWMILGVELIADRDHLEQAGSLPGSVSLKEEDFDDPAAIIESFAAHLMLNFDRWTHSGFDMIAENYVGRLTDKAKSGEAVDGLIEAFKDGRDTENWRDENGPKL